MGEICHNIEFWTLFSQKFWKYTINTSFSNDLREENSTSWVGHSRRRILFGSHNFHIVVPEITVCSMEFRRIISYSNHSITIFEWALALAIIRILGKACHSSRINAWLVFVTNFAVWISVVINSILQLKNGRWTYILNWILKSFCDSLNPYNEYTYHQFLP